MLFLFLVIHSRGQQSEDSIPPRILLYAETAGFRHGSIPDAIAAIESLAGDIGFSVDTAMDSTPFTTSDLSRYAAVVFVLTTGEILNTEEQAAFESYIRNGGGYVGIHSASDTEYSWPWYGQLVGAYFANHPTPQSAVVLVEDRTHPSTRHLPERWERFDEWYNFRANPRSEVNVLLALDEDSYSGGTMDGDHPIAWYREFDGGRSWYTGGGHGSASYEEEEFLKHIRGGLLYAALGLPPELSIQFSDTGTIILTLSDTAQLPYRVFYTEDFGSWQLLENTSTITPDSVWEYEFGLVSDVPAFFRVEAAIGNSFGN